MASTLFLDMDGVLCDFVGGALRLHGKELDRRSVRWDFASQIGFKCGIDDSEFWSGMGYDFWADLEWTTEGREILEACEYIFGEHIALMTSPCDTPGCVDGKLEWVRRHMPKYKRKIFVGAAKHLAAGPHKFLVDDNDHNIDKFIEHGGSGLLVPRSWNRLGNADTLDENGNFDVEYFKDTLSYVAGHVVNFDER